MNNSNNRRPERAKSNRAGQRPNLTFVTLVLTIVVVLTVSCSRIYDNVEKYAGSETIYADRFDGIIRVQVGFERVEIDLMRAGRIPASQIRMGKATKTVIECADFTETGNRRVIDSIASWVNVTGLTQLKNYELTIYTEDNFGNRSIPLTASVRPFTEENLNALELIAPTIIESTSAALVEWNEPVSALTQTVYRHAYSYADRNGVVRTDTVKGDVPSFFLENIEKGIEIPVTLTCWTIPTLSNFNGTYTPILDTVKWKTTLRLRISENAETVIFLKTPAPAIIVDRESDNFVPVLFSWIKLQEIDKYSLKISTNSNFPNDATYTINVGNVDEYIMNADMINGIKSLPQMNQLINQLFWTVVPEQTVSGRNQVRPFIFLLFRKFKETVPLSLLPATANSQISVEVSPEYITLTATGSDPNIRTAPLGKQLSDGCYLAIEYTSNRESTNCQFFYAVAGAPEATSASPMNIVIPQASEWSWFEYDLTEAMTLHGFGIDDRGGRPPHEHFLRFDPVQGSAGVGYVISVRTIQINVHALE